MRRRPKAAHIISPNCRKLARIRTLAPEGSRTTIPAHGAPCSGFARVPLALAPTEGRGAYRSQRSVGPIMKPTMSCSTGLHSTFLPAFGWSLGAPMICMVELRPEDMNTHARDPERLAAVPPPAPELSACDRNTTAEANFMCHFPQVPTPILFRLTLDCPQPSENKR